MLTEPSAPDLEFANLRERDRQYNARASVADFDACVREYARRSALARSQCVGIHNLRYGLGTAERLDLFPVVSARQPSPLFIFIHGGYWRSQTKEDAALVVKPFTDAGVAVATLEYPLLPEVTLAQAVAAVRRAVAWLHSHAAAYGVDTARIYAGGSSAGAHLTAMLLAPGWHDAFGLPDNVIQGAVCLSGLYDLRPLCQAAPNEWLRLHPEQAQLLSPLFVLPDRVIPLVLSVGGLETDGFKSQTRAFELAWRAKGWPAVRVDAPRRNHFDLLCDLSEPNSELMQASLTMIGAHTTPKKPG